MNVQAFLDTMPLMGKGMLGIFLVAAAIVLSMYLLRWLFRERKK